MKMKMKIRIELGSHKSGSALTEQKLEKAGESFFSWNLQRDLLPFPHLEFELLTSKTMRENKCLLF